MVIAIPLSTFATSTARATCYRGGDEASPQFVRPLPPRLARPHPQTASVCGECACACACVTLSGMRVQNMLCNSVITLP
jgi:hypothetical protein